MKTINRICLSFAICILAVISGVCVANAQVTVNYQVLPDGPILSNNDVNTCTSETSPTPTMAMRSCSGTTRVRSVGTNP